MKKAIIVDIDGTIATHYDEDGSQMREHHDYSLVVDDRPIPEVINLVKLYYSAGYNVLITSGRMDNSRQSTEIWLALHGVPYTKLIMRKFKDFRPDDEVKLDLYETYIEPDYKVEVVLDDRQRVVDMWRRIGLRCLQVDYGDF